MKAPTVNAPRFNGPEYVPDRDNPALAGQMLRIFDLMKDGNWRTVTEIAGTTNDPENSVSAQLRHLRKPRFGSYRVNRRRRDFRGRGALFEYQLQEPEPPGPPEQAELF